MQWHSLLVHHETHRIRRSKAARPEAATKAELGCGVIAEVFNRQFADRVTVGKAYVTTGLRRSRVDVIRLPDR
jgi:hypothetical protein